MIFIHIVNLYYQYGYQKADSDDITVSCHHYFSKILPWFNI